MRWICLAVLVACKPMPPPPFVPLHGDTGMGPKDTTTAMLVVGIAGQLLGGDGAGVALRVDRQVADEHLVGVELTAGRGNSSTTAGKLVLLGLRPYGRYAIAGGKYASATYGAGISYLSSGLVTFTPHVGVAASYVNDYLAPVAQIGLAGALVLRQGDRLGSSSLDFCLGHCPEAGVPSSEPLEPFRSDAYLVFDLELASRFGGTRDTGSIAAGLALPLRADSGGMISVSAGNKYDIVPDQPPAP